MKDKWNVNKLHGMLVQEETRLKNQGTHSIHLISNQGAKKKARRKNEKGKQKPEESMKRVSKDHLR